MFLENMDKNKEKVSVNGVTNLENLNESEIMNLANKKDEGDRFKFYVDDLEYEFEYGGILKTSYYLYKRNVSKLESGSLTRIMYVIKLIADTEDRFEKPFYEFNQYEMSDLIAEFHQEIRSVTFTMLLIYTLRDMANIFPSHFYEKEAWNNLSGFSVVKKIMSNTEKKGLISHNKLLSFLSTTLNRQYAAVVVLFYNGVKLSQNEDIDEMQRIKKEDITEKGIHIKNGKSPRFIHLNTMEITMLKEAAAQKYLIRIGKPSFIDLKNGKNNYLETELVDSEYLFRSVLRTYKKEDGREQAKFAKAISLRRRIEELLKEFNELTGDDLKVKDITNSGKINSIDEYIKKGYSLSDALAKTLVKFGEWEHKLTVKDEKEDPGNKQRKNRLRRLYELNK